MANNKYCGTAADYQPVSEDQSRVVIMYGMKEDGDKAEWYQLDFYKKQGRPSFEAVKAAILNDIDERVKAQIIGGLTWNEKPVWLSVENQLNFSQAVAPVTLKIGEQADGTPIYQEFATKAELKAFNDACNRHKMEQLNDGWAEKDSIDWAPYAEAFQPVSTKE